MAATSKGSFNRLNFKLVTAPSSEFQTLVVRLIRFLAPTRLGTPALGDFDLLDRDLVAWNGEEGFDLVVQCVWFEDSERGGGQAKVEACLKSIESFANRRLNTKAFLVVHNRPGKNEATVEGKNYRKQIDQALDSLKSTNRVNWAKQWNCRALLANLEKALKERVLGYFNETRPATYGVSAADEVVEVPMERQVRLFDRLQLKAVDNGQQLVADPAAELASIGSGIDARAILLGHAGFGKTVAVNRAARGTHGPMILVRAADLAEDARNRNSFLAQLATADQLLAGIPDDDIPTLKPLTLAVMEGVLSRPGVAALLVIDGLDESRALSRPGGLIWLLNILKRYQLPIILTCRSEFWHSRVADFETAFGISSPRPGPMQRDTKLKIIELLEWDEAQILCLSERFRDGFNDSKDRDRIQQFIQLVKDGQYSSIYGDIPKRPLFLQWILETVAEFGVHRVTPIQLLQEFAERKIKRDFAEPRKDGGPGRLAILETDEVLTVTIDIAFYAMMRAAWLMSNISSNGELELLPSCEIRKVLETEPALSNVDDPTGLFLNSLLAPVTVRGLLKMVRFTHQVYQEFFLAKFIERHPEAIQNGVKIPQTIEQWFNDPEAFQSSRNTPIGRFNVRSERKDTSIPRPDVLVISVNEHETRAVHDEFEAAIGRPATPIPLDGRVYRNLGTLNETTVYHALSEMGSSGVGGMQQTVEIAIRALDPGAVIAVGVAFGINENKQAIGDILLSTQLRPYEIQRVGEKIILRGDKPHATARLIDHFSGFAQTTWRGAKVRRGVILTGDKLIDDIDYRESLLEFEDEAVGGEMEGAGLYVPCYEHKVDWIVIKAICDWADGNKSKNKSGRQKKAAKNAVQFIIQALQNAPLSRQK